MADGPCRRIFRFAAALAVGVSCSAAVAQAFPDNTGALRARLTELTHALDRVPEARLLPLADLLAQHDLAGLLPDLPLPAADASPAPVGLARAELVDFRPLVTLMSQGIGDIDNRDVLDSQGARGPVALGFRGGRVDLDLIRTSLRRLLPEVAVDDGVLRVPVVLWGDAVLQLGPDDDIAFSREDGAFLISLGRLEIEGSRLGVTGEANPHSAEFVPFVAVVGAGSLSMHDAVVEGLGFGWTDKFAGLAVLRHPLMRSPGRTQIVGTRFEDVVSVVMTGTPDADVAGNRFYGMRASALRIRLSPRVQVTGNVFGAGSPENAIRLLDSSDGAQVSGNLVLPGEHVGIIVSGGSAAVEVSDNLVWKRRGGGVKFITADCGAALRNLLLDNRQKGIEVYTSPGIRLSDNRIVGNRNAAIWVSGQPWADATWITGNRINGNAFGLVTATPGRIWLEGNDFSRQLPRLAGGDIAFRSRALATDLHGLTPLLLSARGAEANPPRPQSECWPAEAG